MKTGSARILLVDDDADVLLLVGARLRSAGYDVVTAVDGDEAIAAVLEKRPDLLVLDLGLPKKDGAEVCRVLKSDPRTRLMPIIMLSAKSQDADKAGSMDSGADDCMTKPFDPQVLLGAIERLLQASSGEPDSRSTSGKEACDPGRQLGIRTSPGGNVS